MPFDAAKPGCEMDVDANVEDIVRWAELPEDVVAKIQAHLPLVSQLRSRVVCRAWKEAVASPSLLREVLVSRARVPDPWMLFVVDGVYDPQFHRYWADDIARLDSASYAYEPASDRWYQLQLPSWLRPPSLWKQVPLEPLISAYGMLVDSSARCFKLVAVSRRDVRGSVRSTFVFDSALGTWSETTRSFPHMGVHDYAEGRGVFVGTVLYRAIRCAGSSLRYRNCNLLCYDLERAEWSVLVVAKRCLFYIFECHLINLRERLLCVVLGVDSSWRVRWSVQIWELDFAAMAWTVVVAMPDSMLKRFLNVVSLDFFATGPVVGRSIKAVEGQDVAYIMRGYHGMIAALDFGQTPPAWRWLPVCPYPVPEEPSKLRCLELLAPSFLGFQCLDLAPSFLGCNSGARS